MPPSHLFTIRIWQEDLGQGQFEWRGKVQHVSGVDYNGVGREANDVRPAPNAGEVFYFRQWDELTARLQSILEGQNSVSGPT